MGDGGGQMKTTVTETAIQCDGCEYLVGKNVETITVVVRGEIFDFHDGGKGAAERHDCFRYWAHGPRIMRRSLENRGWPEERVEEFLSLMLYREEGGPWESPGIPREPPPPPVRKEGVKL
jgi:hypothetical protein